MDQESPMNTASDRDPERIDVNDKAACESWAHRLNVTHEKLREAVGAVGDDAKTVERHLQEHSDQQRKQKGERAE
jgi:hypothetical protein